MAHHNKTLDTTSTIRHTNRTSDTRRRPNEKRLQPETLEKGNMAKSAFHTIGKRMMFPFPVNSRRCRVSVEKQLRRARTHNHRTKAEYPKEIALCECGHGQLRHSDTPGELGFICLISDCSCFNYRGAK